jgi:hypothetical protein
MDQNQHWPKPALTITIMDQNQHGPMGRLPARLMHHCLLRSLMACPGLLLQARLSNGITQKMLTMYKAQYFDVEAPALLEWMLQQMGPQGGVPVLVAHNAFK